MERVEGDRAGEPGRERSPLLEMLAIAAPVVATMTSFTLMQFVDGLMVSRIGPDPVYVAAQGNGGVVAFIPVSILMGLLTVINTYVAQNYGAKSASRAPAYAWAGLWLCLATWLLLMLPFAMVLPWLFGTLTEHSPQLLALETQYARVLLAGSILTMGARCISQYFYGLHRPMVVLIATLLGNFVNVAANSVLIYGAEGLQNAGPLSWWFDIAAAVASFFGIGAMGVFGAALGTVLGGLVEFAIPFLIFIGPKQHRELATRASWRLSMAHIRDIFRIGWPGALMFGNEMLCWAYLMAALIGHFGEVHNTAGWIALRYMHLAFMPAIGLSIAVTAQVGKCMGMKRPDLARQRTWLGLKLTMGYMGVCAIGFILFRFEAIGLFVEGSMDAEAKAELVRIGSQVMIAAAIFQLFDALGITMIGALRGAGDTVWPGVVTIVLAWVCIVGGGHATIAFLPSLGSLGPWLGASAYIIFLGIAVLYRFLQGKWTRIDLLKRGADEAAGAPPAVAHNAGAPLTDAPPTPGP